MHWSLLFRYLGIEGIHVFARRHSGKQFVGAHSLRKRQLHDDGIRSCDKSLYYLLDLSRIAFLGNVDAYHLDAEALGGARFDADERFDDRVRAYHHYAELCRTGQRSKLWREAGVDIFCNCFSVNNVCTHALSHEIASSLTRAKSDY